MTACPGGTSPEVEARRIGMEQELARLTEMASLKDPCSRIQANLQALSIDEKRLALASLSITVV